MSRIIHLGELLDIFCVAVRVAKLENHIRLNQQEKSYQFNEVKQKYLVLLHGNFAIIRGFELDYVDIVVTYIRLIVLLAILLRCLRYRKTYLIIYC